MANLGETVNIRILTIFFIYPVSKSKISVEYYLLEIYGTGLQNIDVTFAFNFANAYTICPSHVQNTCMAPLLNSSCVFLNTIIIVNTLW